MKLKDFTNVIKRPKAEIEIEEKELRISEEWYKKFQDARNMKASKVAIWDECLDAYNSEGFKNSNKPDYKSDEISNFIFSTIETIKPIMVDNDPKILILPKSPEGVDSSDKIQDLFDAEWSRAKMSNKLPQAITLSLQIGTAVFGMFWDSKSDGIGNANPTIINPYNLFPDPMATSVEDAEYIIYATYKHVNQLKQLFPDKADKLIANQVNYNELISNGQQDGNTKNQVLVLECYARDYTTYEYEQEEEILNDSGKLEKQKVVKKKSKYPNGRIITVAPELQIVLSDKQNPYVGFPFKLLKCYDIPFEFWGKGEIEQLLSPQTYINELTNQIIDNAKLTANMPWVLDKNSGIGKGQLVNRPGLIIRKNPGTVVDRLTPPQMPGYVREMIEIFKQDIEVISGVHDVTQGRKPGSVSAASAIMALQEAAQARIRLKVKLMETALSELGIMWYNVIKKFWVTSRFVRIFDDDNNVSFIEVNPEDLQIDIDFLIVAGSTMPSNKNAMLDLMIRLAQTPAEDGLPMVDRETVLTYTNVPDKKKIVQKFLQHKETQQSEQQSQLEQQQMLAQKQAEQQQLQQMQQMQLKQQIDMQKAQHDAELEQVKNTNRDVTDEQLQAVMQLLKENPEMLQQLMAQQ